MKKLILILIIVIFNQGISLCQSDKKCKYLKNSIDEFSKKREVITKMNELYHKTDFEDGTLGPKKTTFTVGIYGCYFDGQNFLRFFVDYYNQDYDDTPISLEILLDDKTVLPFSGEWKYKIKENNTFYWLDFEISTVNWEKLKTQSVNKIQISFNNYTQKTFEVKSKDSKAIQNAIDCIDALNYK